MKRPYKPEIKVDNKPLVEHKEKKIELKPYRFIGHGFNLEPTPLEMLYKMGMVTDLRK